MTKEWWAKNAGGLFLSSVIGIAMYSASAYITSTVTREMRGYVPVSIWNQWAQEREEWRGQVNQRLKSLESELTKDREENLKAIKDLDKNVAIQTSVLMDVKSKIDKHMDATNR